jgi:hypothetical protein
MSTAGCPDVPLAYVQGQSAPLIPFRTGEPHRPCGHGELAQASDYVLFRACQIEEQLRLARQLPSEVVTRSPVPMRTYMRWTHLMLTTLPLLVLAVVSFLLYRIGLERQRPASTI